MEKRRRSPSYPERVETLSEALSGTADLSHTCGQTLLQKQTLPVLAGSVVLRGSDAADLTPGGLQIDERNGLKP